MALTVQDVLELDALQNVRVVAGSAGLHRDVRWVHIWPEVIPWLHGGEFLLTTGYSWPSEPEEQKRIVRELNAAGLAAILFQTGRFFPTIPEAVLQQAEQASLPILEASSELPFVDMTEAVNREIIRHQFDVIEQSEEIHKTLTISALEAKELQDIAEALSRLIKKPVIIQDTRFQILAQAAGEERMTVGSPEGALEHARERGILWDLKTARKPLRIARLGDLGVRDGIACPIRVAGDLVGYLWVLAGEGTLSDLEIRAAEHGAIVAALHILRQHSVATAEARVRHTFVEALIRGELDKTAGLRERSRLLGFDPEASYMVGLLAILVRGQEGRKRALNSQEELYQRECAGQALHIALSSQQFPVFMGFLLNQVVFLLPADPDRARHRSRVEALWRHIKTLEPAISCALALGGVHPRAEGVATSYGEADQVLTVTEGEGLFWYDEMLLVRLLRSVADTQALRDVYEATLGRLLASHHGKILTETARVLVHQGFNQRAAARALKVHWNTMRHRIARIEEILQRPLSDVQLRINLQLAFEIERVVPPIE